MAMTRSTGGSASRAAQQPQPTQRNRRETQARIAELSPEISMSEADLGSQLFVSATQLVRAVENHFQQRYGLSTGRFAVLVTLSSAPSAQRSPSSLAELLAVTRPTITGVVDGMVRDGLVRRCPDPSNRRNQPVALTDKGLSLVRQIAPDHFRRLAAAIMAFSPAERQTLRRAVVLLERFGEQLVEGLPVS
jgi:DNA-binding MarR family transcriptional regulator